MKFSEADIRGRLSSARLPAMPQILLKLLEQCQNDSVGIDVLVELIAKDPGISSKIFSVAISNWHRYGEDIDYQRVCAADI
jgi:HD-like signal output (HDOD) protein